MEKYVGVQYFQLNLGLKFKLMVTTRTLYSVLLICNHQIFKFLLFSFSIINSQFKSQLNLYMFTNIYGFLPLRSFFCYSKYLSTHIINIIKDKPELNRCITDFDPILQSTRLNEQQITTKLNMVFNVHCLQAPLSDYRQNLIRYIHNDKIKHQSDLDRVVKWLHKNIKYDRNIEIEKMMEKINEEESKQFQQELQRIMNNGHNGETISGMCKILREKYLSVDSKEIYQRVKSTFQSAEKHDITIENSNPQSSVKYFWDKLDSIKPRLLPQQCNDPEIYKQHLNITKGQLRFRFPPQPNGYLHIGHIKSMRINFQTAKRYNGLCFLRYDDTNPETQSHEYIDNILANVKWLGYTPDKITFASDYFSQMIQFAIQLIKQGNAYVCDSPAAEIQSQRLNKIANKFRNRTIEQSLSYFPNLSEGQTLRLKLSPDASNPTLRDPVIYRRKNKAHPRTGSKYQIYPMYDFAHCICDSLEHIDYSLCSLEFEVRRELYYIILELLKLYKPNVWQYSRVNVESALISKRKIKALIDREVITNWDDPRLLTIGGLVKRGYTPNMLINFIDKVNSSRAGNQNVVQYSLLQKQMKKQLFPKSQKYMMVLSPLKATILNLEKTQEKDVLILPQGKQTRKIKISKSIFVQSSEVINPGNLLILKYFGVFSVTQNMPQLLLTRENISVEKLKLEGRKYKIVHWISEEDSIQYPVICFNRLLDKQNNVLEGSMVKYNKSRIPKYIYENSRKDTSRYFQMERLGYFKFLQDGELIRCVTL